MFRRETGIRFCDPISRDYLSQKTRDNITNPVAKLLAEARFVEIMETAVWRRAQESGAKTDRKVLEGKIAAGIEALVGKTTPRELN